MRRYMVVLMRFQQKVRHLTIHLPQLFREGMFGRAVFALAMLALAVRALAAHALHMRFAKHGFKMRPFRISGCVCGCLIERKAI